MIQWLNSALCERVCVCVFYMWGTLIQMSLFCWSLLRLGKVSEKSRSLECEHSAIPLMTQYFLQKHINRVKMGYMTWQIFYS